MNTKRKPNLLNQPSSKRKLKVVEKLKPARKLTVYSSSPTQQIKAKLENMISVCLKLSIIGFACSALSYFCATSLETKVNQNLKTFENQMKDREDLRSYLGKVYSWQNINAKAHKLNLKPAQQIEIAKINEQNVIL